MHSMPRNVSRLHWRTRLNEPSSSGQSWLSWSYISEESIKRFGELPQTFDEELFIFLSSEEAVRDGASATESSVMRRKVVEPPKDTAGDSTRFYYSCFFLAAWLVSEVTLNVAVYRHSSRGRFLGRTRAHSFKRKIYSAHTKRGRTPQAQLRTGAHYVFQKKLGMKSLRAPVSKLVRTRKVRIPNRTALLICRQAAARMSGNFLHLRIADGHANH